MVFHLDDVVVFFFFFLLIFPLISVGLGLYSHAAQLEKNATFSLQR